MFNVPQFLQRNGDLDPIGGLRGVKSEIGATHAGEVRLTIWGRQVERATRVTKRVDVNRRSQPRGTAVIIRSRRSEDPAHFRRLMIN